MPDIMTSATLSAMQWCAALNATGLDLATGSDTCLSLYHPFKQHFGMGTRASTLDGYVKTFGWYHPTPDSPPQAKIVSTQEAWIWHHHVRFMKRPGVYVDLASNDPFVLSNTMFLDHCRGWRGVCVEPNPQHHKRIRALRGCELVPTCISNTTETVLYHFVDHNAGGSNHIVNQSTTQAKVASFKDLGMRPMVCETLAAVLARARISRVDFLSLDVEGHELQALSTLDLATTLVDVIMVEGKEHIWDLLVNRHGYRYLGVVDTDGVFVRRGFKLGIERAGGTLTADASGMISQPRRCVVNCKVCGKEVPRSHCVCPGRGHSR